MGNVLPHGRFYGQTQIENKLPGLVLTETLYPPRLLVPQHSHQNAYFCFVLSGSYTETYGTNTRNCTASTLAFHPPGEVHSEKFDDSAVRSFNVEIEASSIQRIRQYSPIFDRAGHLHGGEAAGLAIRLYGEFRRMDPVSPLAIEGLVLEILATASRASSGNGRHRSDIWLKQAEMLLQLRFAEKLSLDDIANNVGVHPVHLAREFRRCFGCTVGEYLRQLRVESARRVLSDSSTPLKDIALNAGFFDQSHFCRTFRKHTGMTPKEYRRLIS
jgi:AraC family transcriptional regulator